MALNDIKGVQENAGGTYDEVLLNEIFSPILTNPITGTGATGQVAFWNGTNTQTGDTGLLWDNANKYFGIQCIPAVNFQVNQSTAGIGTVSNTAGGTTITGTNTQFLNTFRIGNTITIGAQTVVISAIASNTSMTSAAITAANTNATYTLVGGNRFNVYGNGQVSMAADSKFLLGDDIGDKFNWIKDDYSNALTWGAEAFVFGASASGFVFTSGEDNTFWGRINAAKIEHIGQFKSTISTGTAPIDVTSTTKCTNLNADTVDGKHDTDFVQVANEIETVVFFARLASDVTTTSTSLTAITGFVTGTLAIGTYEIEVIIDNSIDSNIANSCFYGITFSGTQTNAHIQYTFTPDGIKHYAEMYSDKETTADCSTSIMTAIINEGAGVGYLHLKGTFVVSTTGTISIKHALTDNATLSGTGLSTLIYSTFKVTKIN
jgi:hypothetical protein